MTHAALLLLFLPAIAVAQGRITISAPAMPTYRLGVGEWVTARENCTVTASYDGKTVTFPASIDPTPVVGVLRRNVASCALSGLSTDGHAIHLQLPVERVRLGVATPMRSDGWLTTPDGISHATTIYWPACRSRRVGIGVRVAEAITASGEVVLP